MKLLAFSVRDTKVGAYNTPFFQRTHSEAERTFANLVSDPSSMVAKFPEDYDLYYLGEVSMTDGKAEWLDTPRHVIKASNIVLRHGNVEALKPN